MKFAVTSWHFKPVEYWLSQPHAYTMMASPPKWAIEHGRNLPLFIPPARIVFGGVSEEEYTRVYREVLKSRMPAIRSWVDLHRDDHMILLCACPNGVFCHRLLVAKLLTWLGAEEMPLSAAERMLT